MQKGKELQKDIFISDGIGIINNKQSIFNEGKKKSFHPPIETFWQLPPLQEPKRSNHSFWRMISTFQKSFRRMSFWGQSTELVLDGPHNPKDEKIVDSFRELLSSEDQLPLKHYDYHTLLRFLRMRDFDLMKAKAAFLQYIKWRKEFGVDSIAKEFMFEEYEDVKKCYPHGFHGVDRYGRPVYIERLGLVNLDMFLQVTTLERFVKYHVFEQEKTLNWRYPACSLAAKKHIASTISILDVKDVGMSKFSKPARYLFLEIQRIDSCYYPETLHQLFIINAGSGFRVLWKAIKPFLDARTLAKIRVLGTDYKNILTEAIEPSNLPSFFGGDCTCSEYGGCLFSHKGPWNNPEIKNMLQEMLYNEKGHEAGRNADNKHNRPDDSETIQIKDVYDVRPSAEETLGGNRVRKFVGETLLQKIQSIQYALHDAKQKIRMLETALEDTKLVLQGLEQHVEELYKWT